MPLWKIKDSSDPSNQSNENNIEFDPVNVRQVFVGLVSRLDDLSARYEELDSRTNIMQNSVFTVLNKKIDDRLV